VRALVGRALAARCRPNPIVVSGAARSGTTVVTQALGRHPAIASPLGEAPYLAVLGRSVTPFAGGTAAAAYFTDSLRISRGALDERLRQLAFEVALGPHFGLATLLRHAARHRGRLASHWCARVSPDEDAARGLRVLFPALRFVHVVRSGVEVVASRQRFPAFRGLAFQDHCRAWARNVSVSRFLVARKDTLVVRHEELLADPEGSVARVLEGLGVPPHAGPAAFAAGTHLHPLDAPTAFGVAVRDVVATRPAAHADWSAEERAIFVSVCGEAMQETGYGIPF
jgi:hypothetical protein